MGDAFRTRANGKANGTRTSLQRKGLICALDVGSSKIACVIARMEASGVRVLGASLRESQGIRSGTVISLELAEHSIRAAVEAAEQLAGERIEDVILAVQCGQPKSLNARVEGTTAGELVNDGHLRMLLAEAKSRCAADGFETIQAAATGYVLDQSRGVSDPRGMYCDRLGVSVHAVAVRSGPLQNLRLAVERCHLTIARQLYAPFASAQATLTQDEMSVGASLIEMGAGCTSVATFLEDSLLYVDSVPLGGAHITADIAKIFSVPPASAERIKTLYGSVAGLDHGSDAIEVPLMGEEGERNNGHVRRSDLTKVIEARLEEILDQVRSRLRASGLEAAAGRRVVLTGGGAQLSGASELTAKILDKHVRIGKPLSFPGLAEAIAGPPYATALGLLISGATNLPETHDPNPQMVEAKTQRRGIVRWLSENFLG